MTSPCRAASYEVDFTGLSALGYLARHVGAGKPPLQRALALGSFAVSGWRSVEDWDHTHCVLAGDFALRLRLGQQVYDALQHCFERWDGKGAPAGLTGEQLALSARILQLADTAQASYRLGGSPER
jgi:hypothetical protein